MGAYYFFNVITPSGTIKDIEGTELSSLEEARAEAISDARALISAALRGGRDLSGRSIEICNEAGETVLIVTFCEAVSSIE